jgi:hypothetical protein
MDDAGILSRGNVRLLPESAREKVAVAAKGTEAGQPVCNRCSGRLSDLELNRPTGFLLDYRRSITHPAARTHIIDLQPNEVTAPELAVDSEVEHRQVTLAVLQLQPDAYRPDILRLQRALLADQAALIPRISPPT